MITTCYYPPPLGISLRVVDTLVHHIDDCTRPPHRRLNAIDVCTAFVHKNPRAECDDDDHRTYDESCKNAVEYIGWEGTGESSSLPTVFIEVFRAALVRRLVDPSNVSRRIFISTYVPIEMNE